jgi:hypothetical protein
MPIPSINHLVQEVKAVGTHRIQQSKTPSHLQEYQWDVNNVNRINFTSNQLVKLTYRHTPRNETMESLFLDYVLTNNAGVDVNVLPLWAGSIRELRVYINNKRVIDWNREEQCKTSWNTRLLTQYDTDKHRDNHTFIQHNVPTTLDGAGNFTPTLLAPGQSLQFHLKFAEILDIFNASLPLHKVGQIEIEMNLSNRGDFVCNPATEIGNLEINDLQVYSRHKQYVIPPPHAMGSFAMLHYDYDVFQLSAAQHPFNASVGNEFDINLHTEFPRRRHISRILVFARSPTNVEAYRQIDSGWVSSMELLRGGLTLMGTEYHYDTERKIYKEVTNWTKRHHSCAFPTHPGDAGHGESFFSTFIDCSTIQHNQNFQASENTKSVELNGLDNITNLVLRIRNDNRVTSAIDSNLVIMLEFPRVCKLLGNGNVVKVTEANP